MKIPRKRLSVDFWEPVYSMVVHSAKKQGRSGSYVVNKTLETILSLTPDIRKELALFCNEQYVDSCRRGGFDEQESRKWRSLKELFELESISLADRNMTTIPIKDGIVTFPSDWVILDVGNSVECMYAGVVEIKNDEKYTRDGKSLPHMLFYCNYKYANDYPNSLKNDIYSAIKRLYPEFSRIIQDEPTIEEYYSVNYKTKEGRAKGKELASRPAVGLFALPEYLDPIYWNSSSPNFEPVLGAMVVRSDTRSKAPYNIYG